MLLSAALPNVQPAADGAVLLTTISCVAVAAGIAISLLALKLFMRLRSVRAQAQADLESAKAGIAFRDALLASDGEAATVLDGQSLQTGSADKANALVRAAMDGPDARRVADALSQLMNSGTAFRFVARTQSADAVALRGATIWNKAVAFARRCAVPPPALDYPGALESLPIPVWVRGADLSLVWGNRAFLDITDAASLQNALAVNASLQRSEMDLAASALEAGSIEAVRYALVDGERRAFVLKFVRLASSLVVGVALDMTEKAKAEGRLRLHVDAAADMLEGLPLGVAVFGKDRRLSSWNALYAKTWGFSEAWLETRPTRGDVLDRLRETRQLPEQQDYTHWKLDQLALFEDGARQREECWHLANGRSLKITTRPHLLGGVAVVVEDVTDALTLESSFKLLVQVQRATLDVVDDGMAVFAPDGRLVLSNRAFGELWRFSESELGAQPHFTTLAQLADARLGHDAIWSILGTGIQSPEPERCNEWGKAKRADGRTISLSMSRLPNGATIATFCDLTNIERFRDIAEGPHVAA